MIESRGEKMDLKEIKRLIQLVEEANVSSFKVEVDGLKVEIKKEFGQSFVSATPAPVQMIQPVPSGAPVQNPVVSDSNEEGQKAKNDGSIIAIKSPMVGTFYSRPNPDAAPYAKVGDRIESGKVVCIIEAMKLFNEIESEISGTVDKILVDHASPVEYGQELFLIRVE